MPNFSKVGITLHHPILDRIEVLAERSRKSRAECIRLLIELGLPHAEKSIAPDYNRLLILQEHQTLVLDALARKHIPEEADRLARLAEANVKRHHGA